MELFERARDAGGRRPLAARMRPVALDEVLGQQHLLAQGKLLRRAIEGDRIESLIFYGPPGTGKTTLASVIARQTKSRFEKVNAVDSSTAELRTLLRSASASLEPTLLFIDEIHRFNKAQQDVLLPDVESGVVRLIGATTQNPFFCLTTALVSRSMVFELRPLESGDLVLLGHRVFRDSERGLGGRGIETDDEALNHLARVSEGDARRFLNALEIAALTTPPGPDGKVRVGLHEAQESIQKKAVVYDGTGDGHYDTISAFIKSIRGSDPDAAIYWLAKMLHAGEDPRFVSRRLIIAASEDIGMADPQALLVATAAQAALETVGLPEARLNLAQAVIYLATAPKSNRCTEAIGAAAADVASNRTLAVPPHLQDGHYAGAAKLGKGVGYKYSHDFDGAFVPQAYLPEGRVYYRPSDRGYERRVAERMAHWQSLMQDPAHRVPPHPPDGTEEKRPPA